MKSHRALYFLGHVTDDLLRVAASLGISIHVLSSAFKPSSNSLYIEFELKKFSKGFHNYILDFADSVKHRHLDNGAVYYEVDYSLD